MKKRREKEKEEWGKKSTESNECMYGGTSAINKQNWYFSWFVRHSRSLGNTGPSLARACWKCSSPKAGFAEEEGKGTTKRIVSWIDLINGAKKSTETSNTSVWY